MREHLDLDAAFISEFVDNDRVFRFVDNASEASPVKVGGSDPREASYCHYVVSGQMPEFIADPAKDPVAASMPVTKELPVGTHLSVPIRFSNGRVFGTFCCFGHDVRDDLSAKDLRALRMMAELVGEYLEELSAKANAAEQRRKLIQQTIDDPDGLAIVFQPLIDMDGDRIVAVEALARFRDVPKGPAWFFTEAWNVGLGVELEIKAIRQALSFLDQIPPAVALNVNVSPDTLVSGDFYELVSNIPLGRLVVEVTEHAAVIDYDALRTAGRRLAARGIRMSIDDVGAGFAGLTRIIETPADELKIDGGIIRNVDTDPVKRAMVEALVSFSARAGFRLVAECIETEAEVRVLRELGVTLGQGFHFARPGPLADFFDPSVAHLHRASGA